MATMSTVRAEDTLSNDAGEGKVDYRFAFGLVTSLFFMFGFITCLNDILIPHLKTLFNLDYARASLVQFCFFGAYFLVSLPGGRFVSKVGYQMGAVTGLLMTALGCCLFYPAASLQSYALFLCGLFVLASGVTIIQVAVNPYISILGPAKTASVRLNLAQAFNSLGTTLAPLAGAALILSVAVKSANDLAQMSAADVAVYRATQASSVQLPYLLLAGVLAVLAAIMGFSRLPQLKGTEASASLSGLDSALKSRRLVLGTIAIFCYVGAEVAIGSYLINFLGLSEVWAAPEAVAGTFVAFYWGGAMVGRFIGAAIMKTVRPSYVIIFNAGLAAVLVTVAVLTSGSIAGWALIAVGLMNSIMFPTIFTLAIEGLGDKTPQGSAVLCMAIVGGAIIPLMQGLLADRIGLHTSLLLPVVCYIAIAAYGKTVSGGATTQAA